MTDLRGYTLTLNASAQLVTETCFKCGVLFAMTDDYRSNRLRKRDTFHCPNRQRFANGVCPCCNRSFENVRRHMATQHPDYDPTELHATTSFTCSCGKAFETLRGLRTHQGHMRPDDWVKRAHSPSAWERSRAHLTVTGAR